MTEKRKIWHWLVLALLSLIWGTSYILMKKGLESFSSAQVGALRILITSICLLPIALKNLSRLNRNNILSIIIIGLFGSAIPAFLFPLAETKISSSLAGMLNSLSPVFTLVLGITIYKRKAIKTQIAGVFLGLIGAAGLLYTGSFTFNLYGLLVVLATIMYGFSSNEVSKVRGVNGIQITALSFFVTSPMAIIYLMFSDMSTAFHTENWVRNLSYIGILAIFGSAIALVIFYVLIRDTSPVFAATVTYFIPIVATLWGLADNEHFASSMLISLIFIFAGVFIIHRPDFFKRERLLRMNKYSLVALSVAGGILLGLAWTEWCSGLILLIAFVPFFLVENHLFRNPGKFTPNTFFILVLPGFVVFSIIAIGWMRVASMTGAICVILGLSFLMSFVLWLTHIVRFKKGNVLGSISLISFWLGYEFISLNINIVSPWLNLGNGLSKDIMFIQWYEVTGTAGGSVWILLSNLFLTLFLINFPYSKKRYILFLIIWLFIVLVPSALSITRYNTIKQSDITPEEVIIVQPNIDPYTEKFVIPFESQLRKVIFLAETTVTDMTTWIITPETTVDDPVNIDDLNSNKYVRMIRELVIKQPGASVVTGLVSYKVYPPSHDAPTISARLIDSSGNYYDHFNSALKIDSGRAIEIYHKSKLVPGIEMQFSSGPGRLISKILPSLGGTKWGYGIQKERLCFTNQKTSSKIAPIICYESVFGKYVTEYVKNGANSLFIITNDGWWKNTNGYRQHLYYASLRAIETRRPVARAGNTGISCLIDIRGKRGEESDWWTQTILKGKIVPEKRMTFYVKYGDYLLLIGSFTGVIILLASFIGVLFRKKY